MVWLPVIVGTVDLTRIVSAKSSVELRRTLGVALDSPVLLDVMIPRMDLLIAYGANEQLSLEATAQGAAEKDPRDLLVIEQTGNHIRIATPAYDKPEEQQTKIVCRIAVPYRTEVHSVIENGTQNIVGIMGPVKAETSRGDIRVSYVSKEVFASTAIGNLEFKVIGSRVEAKAGDGNISCARVAQGTTAQTEDGDIVLKAIGPSTAVIMKGSGRVDADGVLGSFGASTAAGDVIVRAMPHDDWRLTSTGGNIRVELPSGAPFEIDAATTLGKILVERDDIESPAQLVRQLHAKVNGGGKHVEARTERGRVVLR